jgi:type VI secretion system protein ImpM
MKQPVQPGFYGKLPILGDFVSRRLPAHFIGAWDQWLQSAIAASREQLGETWLGTYLTSPIWRFAVRPGICGNSAWAGILMPSVDKVGRYYPLTLAAPLVQPEHLPYLFDGQCPWFEQLEGLALSALEDGFDLDAFDGRLQALHVPAFLQEPAGFGDRLPDGQGHEKPAFHLAMQNPKQLPAAFIGLSACLLERFLPRHSLWSTTGSQQLGVSLLVCQDLPPVDAFAALMTGQWQQRGWAMQSRIVPLPPGTPKPAAAKCDESAEDPPPQPIPSAGRAWRSYGASVVGKRRKVNEDAFIERPESGFWAVADGMGGHQAGEVASRAIVDALASVPAADDLDIFVKSVESRLQQVNDELCRLAAASASGQIIGSTVVVFLSRKNRCAFLWAGDSRLYRLRGDKLDQLTRDHSVFNELPAPGAVRAGQRDAPEPCNVITRAVGADAALALDSGYCEAEEGDRFLLCSDGLNKEVPPTEIAQILAQGNCRSSAATLIDRALDRGARDNVTVIVIQAPGNGQPVKGLRD